MKLTLIIGGLLIIAVGVESRGPLIWQEEFDFLDYSRWKHLITAWRGGNGEFEFYHNYSQNRCVKEVTHFKDFRIRFVFKNAVMFVAESFISNLLLRWVKL